MRFGEKSLPISMMLSSILARLPAAPDGRWGG